MFERIIGVFKLDVNTFEEIENDPDATTQAAIVVAIVAVLAALGSGIGAAIGGTSFISNFFGTLIWAFIGWFLWSAITYFVGTTFFEGQADLSEMLRVIGYAYAPQLLGIIPCIGFFIGLIWSLVAVFVAIRQGLDLDNTKTFLTILVGFVVYLVGMYLISLITGGLSLIPGL